MPLTGQSDIAEYVCPVTLSRQDLAGMEDDAVTLAAKVHGIAARLVLPIPKTQRAFLDERMQVGRETFVIAVTIEHVQQSTQLDLRACAAYPDILDRFDDHFFVDIIPPACLHFCDLCKEVLS